MNVRKTLVAAAVAAFATVQAASAETIVGSPVTLQSLLGGGTVLVGDKLFSNFNYSFTGDMPAPANVNVVGLISNLGNYGLRFQGGFTDTTLSAGPSDALITYRVTVLDPLLTITDAHLDSNIDVIPNGLATGFATITEGFVPVVPPLPLITQQISNFDFENLAPGTYQRHDFFAWGSPGYKSIDISKDILMFVESGVATLSLVDQTYSQSAVPLPASALSGIALLAGLAVRRRLSTST